MSDYIKNKLFILFLLFSVIHFNLNIQRNEHSLDWLISKKFRSNYRIQ